MFITKSNKVNKIMCESILTNIVEDDYAFYVHPDTYINLCDFEQNEKEVLDNIKEKVIEKTKGAFSKWSLNQRAHWISKFYVTVEGSKISIAARKRVGDWKNIHKNLLESKHRMRTQMVKRNR